jgi:hypothetical protein
MRIPTLTAILLILVGIVSAAPPAQDVNRDVSPAMFDSLCDKKGNCKAPTCSAQPDKKVTCRCEVGSGQTALTLITAAAPENNGFRLACVPPQMLPQ